MVIKNQFIASLNSNILITTPEYTSGEVDGIPILTEARFSLTRSVNVCCLDFDIRLNPNLPNVINTLAVCSFTDDSFAQILPDSIFGFAGLYHVDAYADMTIFYITSRRLRIYYGVPNGRYRGHVTWIAPPLNG